MIFFATTILHYFCDNGHLLGQYQSVTHNFQTCKQLKIKDFYQKNMTNKKVCAQLINQRRKKPATDVAFMSHIAEQDVNTTEVHNPLRVRSIKSASIKMLT